MTSSSLLDRKNKDNALGFSTNGMFDLTPIETLKVVLYTALFWALILFFILFLIFKICIFEVFRKRCTRRKRLSWMFFTLASILILLVLGVGFFTRRNASFQRHSLRQRLDSVVTDTMTRIPGDNTSSWHRMRNLGLQNNRIRNNSIGEPILVFDAKTDEFIYRGYVPRNYSVRLNIAAYTYNISQVRVDVVATFNNHTFQNNIIDTSTIIEPSHIIVSNSFSGFHPSSTSSSSFDVTLKRGDRIAFAARIAEGNIDDAALALSDMFIHFDETPQIVGLF